MNGIINGSHEPSIHLYSKGMVINCKYWLTIGVIDESTVSLFTTTGVFDVYNNIYKKPPFHYY
jgi:hypothetical protein